MEEVVAILLVIGLVLMFNIAASLGQIVTHLRAGREHEVPRVIQTVTAGSDDLVIFRCAKTLKHEQREELRTHIRTALGGGPKIFVLEGDIQVEAVFQAGPENAPR